MPPVDNVSATRTSGVTFNFAHELVVMTHGTWPPDEIRRALLKQNRMDFDFVMSVPRDDGTVVVRHWDMLHPDKAEELVLHKDAVPLHDGRRTYNASAGRNSCLETLCPGKRIGFLDLDTIPVPEYTERLLNSDLPVWGWIAVYLDKPGGVQGGGPGIVYARPQGDFDPVQMRYDENFLGWGYQDLELIERMTNRLGPPRAWNGNGATWWSAPALAYHKRDLEHGDEYAWKGIDGLRKKNNERLQATQRAQKSI